MNRVFQLLLCVLMLSLVGCAKTRVTEQSEARRANLPRPNHVYVYPFAVDYDQLQPWSNAYARVSDGATQPSPEDMETGRKLGALVAKELAAEINKMGITGVVGSEHSAPRTNDVMLIGYFGSMEGGSAARRMVLGFGAGSADLVTAVEGYQMTATGPRLLGTADLQATGSKTPGLFVPVAVFAATSNPIGLAVVGGAKVVGEVTGGSKLEGNAKRTAQEIAKQLQVRFRNQGWIQ